MHGSCGAGAPLRKHQLSSDRRHRCHRCDPGSIPGWCTCVVRCERSACRIACAPQQRRTATISVGHTSSLRGSVRSSRMVRKLLESSRERLAISNSALGSPNPGCAPSDVAWLRRSPGRPRGVRLAWRCVVCSIVSRGCGRSLSQVGVPRSGAATAPGSPNPGCAPSVFTW